MRVLPTKRVGRPSEQFPPHVDPWGGWPPKQGQIGYSREVVGGVTLYYKGSRAISRVLVPHDELARLEAAA